MGQYKVPQNVEAEDKILGPLTFKQFIYALIGIAWGGLSFVIFRSIPALMVVIGAPPTLLFLMLGFYQRDGQNFEQLLLAMVGYFSQSHYRIWQKEEVIETFHVEPVKIEEEQSQRNPVEVRSQLEKLATMMDARGVAPSEREAELENVSQQHPHLIEPQSTTPTTEPPALVAVADTLPKAPATPTPPIAAVAPAAAKPVLPAPTIPAPQPAPLVAPQAVVAPVAMPQPTAAPQAQEVSEVPVAGAETDMLDLKNSPLALNLSELLNQASQDARQAAVTQMQTPAPKTPSTSTMVTPPVSGDILKLASEDELTVSQVAAQANRIAPISEGQVVDLRTNGNK